MKKKIEFIISGSGFLSLIFGIILMKNKKEFLIFEKLSASSCLKDDQKSFAISKFSYNLLLSLGIWDDELQDSASPIQNIYIYDDCSKNPSFMKDFCIFENDEPMGFMIDSFVLKKKLIEKIGIEKILFDSSYSEIEIDEHEKNLIKMKNSKTDEEFEIEANFFFVCEGKNSLLHEFFGIKSFKFDYMQSALLFKITHSGKHNFSALEKFFEDGMIATLPLKNQNESSIVWILKNEYFDKIENLDEDKLSQILEKKIDHCLGKIQMNDSKKAKYPLSLKFLSKVCHKNVFFLGDSAHAIHPVAGQGLNLGISDLIRILKSNNSKFELEFIPNISYQVSHSESKIESYLKKFRRSNGFLNFQSMFFNLQMIGFTHFLNLIFLSQNQALKIFRNKMISLFGGSKILNQFLKKNATGTKS